MDPRDLVIVHNHLAMFLKYEAIPKVKDHLLQADAVQTPMDPATYRYVRNTIDVYIKLVNSANRMQASTGLLKPHRAYNTRHSDRGTVCRLVYYPGGGLGRLFLYDKTGLVNTTPTMVPLRTAESKYLCTFLYLTREINGPYVFPKDRSGKKWDTHRASTDILRFVREETGLTGALFPKAHFFRNLFLNKIGVEHDYEQGAFTDAGAVLRNDVNQIHGDYLKWTRQYHSALWGNDLSNHLEDVGCDVGSEFDELHADRKSVV